VNEDRGPRRRRAQTAVKPRTRTSSALALLAASALIVIVALVWLTVSVVHWVAPAGNSVVVPSFIGLQYAAGLSTAKSAGVRLHIVARKPDYHAPKDQIVGQLPAAGEHVREGRTIDVVVSDGQPTAKVPNVANLSVRDATVALENARLDVGKVDSEINTDVPAGTVLFQKPDALSDVPAGTKVDLTVAAGRPIAYAPNFVGMSLQAAIAAAKDAHVALAAPVALPIAPGAPAKGIVSSQDPPAGQLLKPHDRITLQISGGAPPASPSPSPLGPSPASPQAPGTTTAAPSASQPSLLPSPGGVRGLRVSVALPESPTAVRIRVVLLDATGSRSLYDQQTRGGFTLTFDITVQGAGTLQTYVGDALVNSTPL
jgi:serine/threonine-protein kinase